MIDLTTLGTVTSKFGVSRNIDGIADVHNGIDIVLKNSNIPAVTGGTVLEVGNNHKSMGNYIKIKQDDGTTATYMHMAYPSWLKAGDTVKEGSFLGIMGTTGRSTGVHLHYQVAGEDGKFIDPASYMSGDYVGTMSTTTTEGTSSNTGNYSILGRIVLFIVLLLVAVVACYLTLKAFDIQII